MASASEKLIVKMAKHPLVWMGTGIWLRNYDAYTERAEFWKGVASVALLAGITHALDEHAKGHAQGRTTAGVLRQIFTSHPVSDPDEQAIL
jgi:hypothetical protein